MKFKSRLFFSSFFIFFIDFFDYVRGLLSEIIRNVLGRSTRSVFATKEHLKELQALKLQKAEEGCNLESRLKFIQISNAQSRRITLKFDARVKDASRGVHCSSNLSMFLDLEANQECSSHLSEEIYIRPRTLHNLIRLLPVFNLLCFVE